MAKRVQKRKPIRAERAQDLSYGAFSSAAGETRLPAWLLFVLAFLIPSGTLTVVYALFGIHPFGGQSLLIMDLSSQYVNFFAYLRQVVFEGQSLLYSWEKGIGGNMIGLVAFYLSSPFSILAVFFPAERMADAVFLINILKIGTAGMTFSIFLRAVFRRQDGSVLVFAVLYALMGYAVAYSMAVKWLDAVLWLPVILLGVERIVQGRRPLLFLLSFTCMMLSNYYTGYMTALFAGVYFFMRFWGLGERGFAKKLGTLVGCGCLALCLGTFLILPTICDLLAGKGSTATYVAPGFFSPGISGLPRRLFMGQYDSLTNNTWEDAGVPNIFCGAVTLVLLLCYFFNSRLPKRERLAAAGAVVFLLLSFCIKRLDMVWHGFRYPNWFPFRYAFVFCFLALFLAYRSFTTLTILRPGRLAAAAVILLAAMAAAMGTEGLVTNRPLAVVSLLLALFYALLLYGYQKLPHARGIISCCLLLAVCLEAGGNAMATVKGLDEQFGYVAYDEYRNTVAELSAAIQPIKNPEDVFYRTEKNEARTDNDSLCVGYNGMSHYSSTYNQMYNAFNYAMGMKQEYISSKYAGATMLIDALFGVRYLLSEQPPNDTYRQVDGQEGVYENPYALSIGYMAEESALKDRRDTADFLLNQDRFFADLTGVSCYRPLSLTYPSAGDMRVFEVTVPDQQPIYLEAGECFEDNFTLSVNGVVHPYPYNTNARKVVYLGRFQAGDVLRIQLHGSDADQYDNLHLYSFNQEEFAESIEALRAQEWKLNTFRSTRLSGTVTAQKDGILFTTIPADSGWRAMVDGEQTEVLTAQGAFVALRVPQGTHQVSLTFRPPGLAAGIGISAAAWLCLAGWLLWKRKKRREKGLSLMRQPRA